MPLVKKEAGRPMLCEASVQKEGQCVTASIIVAANAGSADREIIASGVRAFNEGRAGSSQASPLAVLLKDDSGQTVGGLWGRTSFGWLFVELLFVPEALRGRRHGVRLMEAAENVALARNCHAVWLDTYDFQAVPFYEQLGYREFGRLEDYPREHTRHFLRKNL
jgi:GNAT superfamily N-acetyltransferase